MSAPWLMISATLLFAEMGVCIKLASAQYGAGEVVYFRGLAGFGGRCRQRRHPEAPGRCSRARPARRGAARLLAISVLATTAQMMMTRAYKIGRTLTNTCLQYLGIVFAFGFGVLLFDDAVTGRALAGMLPIVLAGLAATLLRARQAPETKFPSGDS